MKEIWVDAYGGPEVLSLQEGPETTGKLVLGV